MERERWSELCYKLRALLLISASCYSYFEPTSGIFSISTMAFCSLSTRSFILPDCVSVLFSILMGVVITFQLVCAFDAISDDDLLYAFAAAYGHDVKRVCGLIGGS